ncbi:acyl-CoA carboxylase subunit beta [Amycolatopsis sp. H20-H5]|uniref:acyl-CoA carboxylase subunit beta n=1 Tax=Amycolatopsis sp. H20-H5 TaxID=3046309 RepID=UPI002DB9B9B5|nr:acyl-CoA carboxylase subunit beta [Amycolatopsis sp. H20-H5]MEC3978421.1 acyl-CoA carboxylase subunit beta [Amycolatopsis sp. H20-H5]
MFATDDEPAQLLGHGTAGVLADLADRQDEAVRLAEKRARDRQHGKGKLTARERVDLLLDPGSFLELDQLARHRCAEFGMGADRPYGDGVVTGLGEIDGRRVAVFSQDFSVFGGSMGETFGAKVLKVMDLALKTGCPVIGINDSGGARIQEGVVSLAHYAELAMRTVRASGVIPQISLILGPCAGGAVYAPALTDVTVMVEHTSHMFVTGPEVVAAVTGERLTAGELGGPKLHNEVSGVSHFLAEDEPDAISYVRSLLGYLPPNNLDEPPVYADGTSTALTAADEALDRLIPDDDNQAYDMYSLIESLVDDGELLEIQPGFARNIVCGFARVRGRSVGVVANQPRCQAGVIDLDASDKAARFVRLCDAFSIPLVTLVDVPGYLPGAEQERGGIIRHGAKLLYAYAEATVPKVTVVVRKAYGGGYAVMGSKHLGADVNLAWPTADIAVMGAEGAVPLLHRREIAALDGEDRDAARVRLTEEYRERFTGPYAAAERGYVDKVIRPAETRLQLGRALDVLRGKRAESPRRRHGNIPL